MPDDDQALLWISKIIVIGFEGLVFLFSMKEDGGRANKSPYKSLPV